MAKPRLGRARSSPDRIWWGALWPSWHVKYKYAAADSLSLTPGRDCYRVRPLIKPITTDNSLKPGKERVGIVWKGCRDIRSLDPIIG